ncbi:hypothetical protein GIR22_04150 [Pseudomonas sp. CCM 7891]|uniref:DUF1120 domain-containing protein n=1 Tax=Pseudomonas karstica TaxID=1055468 RepID=A0A7X2RR23_9PSED|nr:hypothetical protein [Pseudomonas karstica]MTD18337.1 hypothetical protein [Pseudomonas karstica]
MSGKPENLHLGLLTWLLLFVALMAHDARAENCLLSVSQPHIDYGVIRSVRPVERTSIFLGTRTLHLNVICKAPSPMALRFTGASAGGQGFRFGPQGRFFLSLKHARMDGRAVEWTVAHVPGKSGSGRLSPGQALQARAAGIPLVGRRLTVQVDIDTELPAAALAVRNETLLEGLGRFELVSPVVAPNQ